jgi:hypothetical protein
MFKGTSAPTCSRFSMTKSMVPFQPNLTESGAPNPLAGRDDAILLGATVADPGGLPLGTLEYLTFSRFANVAGTPFQATVHLRSGSRTLERGQVALDVPDGWTVDGPKRVGRVTSRGETTVTFTVTPSATATPNQNARIAARYTTGSMSGYTDDVVRIVPAAEGRFERWGNWAEYDAWVADVAPQAARLGRSPAIASIGLGTSREVGVVVRNWSAQPQSGEVTVAVPEGFSVDAATKPYASLAAGAETTVRFVVTSTATTLPAVQNSELLITTSSGAGSSSEVLTMTTTPTTAVAVSTTEPVVDGVVSPGEYPGAVLDLGRIWQGVAGCAGGTADCGVSTTGEGSTARVSRSGDALYFLVDVKDDYQSYAVTPAECVAHWQADSVELLIDPRGRSSEQLLDTAGTFKLGVFPFTNDPQATNGNGANGPCWSRDADNHQGYSTGPLAATVSDAPNAPGVEVASTATWVGSNETTTPHAYAGGGYRLEVKIPLSILPAAVDPERMGLNITPYDNDDTSAAGTTTLRHIDNSTRLGWSALGSVQSDPYRWGLATLRGYAPPADRPTTTAPVNVSSPNLDGLLSPQTIAQSARNGVPISGRTPIDPRQRLTVQSPRLTARSVDMQLVARSSGTAQVFLWSGETGYIPVYTTSCSITADPPPDYGLTPCAITDGGIPAWSPDMSGRRVVEVSADVDRGRSRVLVPLTADQRARLATGEAHLLVSFENEQGQVQAIDLPLAR